MNIRRLFLAVGLLFVAGMRAGAAETPLPPQVSCRAAKTTWVDAKDLTAHTTIDTTAYDVVGEDLFILPSDRPRYRYNSIRAAAADDPNRFMSGHFTLLFSDDHRKLMLVRANDQDVKVTAAQCKPSKAAR